MFARLFKKDPLKAPARKLYDGLVEAARNPALYGEGGAPDTVDGRFDLITLHAVLVFRRLRDAGDHGQALSQLVFDIMFDDMDAALREMGTGDLSVGKKIREMGEAFYGRAQAYEPALVEADAPALAQAIARNMFDAELTDAPGAARLADYAVRSAASLGEQDLDALLDGAVPAFGAAA